MENKSYKEPICKGSFMLGSACGTCEKCLEEIELLKNSPERKVPTKQILKMDEDFLEDLPGCKSYDMYYSGWECDHTFWRLPDGRKFCTNHGSLEEFSDKAFKKYRKNLKNYLKSIKEL